MSLAEATRQALAAAEAGDLEALARALDARAEAIATGARPTPAIVQDGERAVELLKALLHEAGLESARLKRIRDGFAARPPRAPHVDCRG